MARLSKRLWGGTSLTAAKELQHAIPSRLTIFVKIIPLKLFYYQTFFETWHS